MTRRALLIGSQTGGLSGVETDVERISDVLGAMGFETRRCIRADATRDGIFDAYTRFIADCTAGDVATVYYSGHGNIALNQAYAPTDAKGNVRPAAYQFIVPYDIDSSSTDDFRGILDLELSALLQGLTERTQNATVILDCCHSARLSRDVEMLPKALPRPWHGGIAGHVDQLRSRGLPVDRLAAEGNPHAVRLVACGQGESAYEYFNAEGVRCGLLTDALITALVDAREQRVSWARLAAHVRNRVLEIAPTQRPDVEGPAARALFEMELIEETGTLPILLSEGQPVLQGGGLFGVDPGDEYAVFDPLSDGRVGTAHVTSVSAAQAVVEVEFAAGYSSLPTGAYARPGRKAVHRFPVRLVTTDPSHPVPDTLADRIAAAPNIRVADPDLDSASQPIAKVQIEEGQLALRDRDGNALAQPKPVDDAGQAETVQNLVLFARAQALLQLASGEGPNELSTPFSLEWGRIVDGQPHPLATSGEMIFAGERVYIGLTNHGDETLHCWVFDVGVSSRISTLSRFELAPHREYVVGTDRASGKVVGQTVRWPASVPPEGHHIEIFLAIVSDRPQDLSALEQRGVRAISGSRLEQILAQLTLGGKREADPESNTEEGVRFAVAQIAFVLDPNPPPTRELGGFLVDERPDPSLLYLAPRAAADVPKAVAIRITELIVHRNRVLFGGAFAGDVRIDTIVGTGGHAKHAQYRPETARFPRVKDGERLPLDNMLVFYGPVADFIDLAVWVSRDDKKDTPALMGLLQKELNSAEFKAAAITLGTLAFSAPQAAVAVGAIGAGATLSNVASRLLAAALGKSIGLYRTSFLAHEGFKVGRHPSVGTRRAQDFSFSLQIERIE